MHETAVESHQGVPRLVGGNEYHKFRSGHMSASDRQAFHVTLCLATSAEIDRRSTQQTKKPSF